MNTYKCTLYIILILSIFIACNKDSTSRVERKEIIKTIISYEVNAPFSIIRRCKINNRYLVYNNYNNSIRLDDSLRYKVDSQIEVFEITKQYKREITKKIETDFDTNIFYLIDRNKHVDNRSPSVINMFISKPIKYLKYYFSQLDFNDWSSGYGTKYVLKKEPNGKFIVIFSKLVWLS